MLTCRENPDRTKCLGVFGLSLYTTERELEKEFGRYRIFKYQMAITSAVHVAMFSVNMYLEIDAISSPFFCTRTVIL